MKVKNVKISALKFLSCNTGGQRVKRLYYNSFILRAMLYLIFSTLRNYQRSTQRENSTFPTKKAIKSYKLNRKCPNELEESKSEN